MSLQSKLSRLKNHLTVENKDLEKNQQPQKKQTYICSEEENSLEIPFMEKWEEFGVKPFFFEEQFCLIRTKKYPLEHKHGLLDFSDLTHIVDKWNNTDFVHPLSSKGRSASELLFFDTETTGLGGGVGTTIFLLGVAKVTEDSLEVKQYFLPQPGNEVALYHQFLTEVNEMKNLVTYNGKAFDWPQVKTRHTLVRDRVPQLPPFGHFDLLHASRRVWKRKLDSVRLSMVEKEILGVNREEDTPGYLAPLLYFEYIKDQDPETIQGVFKHNELDVLSLVLLYIQLSKLIFNPKAKGISEVERFELGRWFEAISEVEQAKSCYQHVMSAGGIHKVEAQNLFAGILKKQNQLEAAVTIWEEIVINQDNLNPQVCIELAKAYEHHYKDFDKAMYYADLAYKSYKEQKRLSRNIPDQTKIYIHRIDRLRNKIVK
jgi:uncharacterized protein YprB with RNaseH-like and TPR domain